MFTGELYPYQQYAVDRILYEETLLVAYSMGLGKTPITIAAVEDLAEDFNRSLIVVPASLKWQWAKAFIKFTDAPWFAKEDGSPHIERSRIIVIDGNREQRDFLWELANELDTEHVICSYNALLTDYPAALAMGFDVMVLDEATHIKSFRSKTAKLIKKLQPRYRIALSGAPLENRPEELFSIMQWVDPSVFGRWDLFDKSFIVRNTFGGVERYKNLDLLHAKLKTAMVRKSRKDEDVAPYLPDVTETDVPVLLDMPTRRTYRRIEKDLLNALDELKASGQGFNIAEYYAGAPSLSLTARGRVMSRMQVLHMLLDHPILVAESARLAQCSGNAGSQYAADLMRTPGFVLSETSPKLDALDELVGRMLEEEDSKIIIFTQYRRMMQLISTRLAEHYAVEDVLYHGGLTSQEKAKAAQAFHEDPDTRLFISTDAGGYGLDLPAANYLVNYDLPYSGGTKVQRDTRHVRVASIHSNVYVHNLVCESTVEERVRRILSLRADVADAVVEGSGKSVIVNDIGSLTEHLLSSPLVTL